MNKTGYKIYNKSNELREFQSLKSTIDKIIISHHPFYNGQLDDLHHLAIPNINALRLDCFKALNQISDLDSILTNLVGDEVKSILGPDLLIQKKINLSIQMPNDESSILKPHSDCWSGDSPFQINAWIPLTDAFETNSMFLFDQSASMDLLRAIYTGQNIDFSSITGPENFLHLNFGEILIFNPGLVHGNVLNQTAKTRVSLNIRFKSIFTPDGISASRSSGVYYRIFGLSPWTKLAFELNEANSGGR